MDLSERIAIGDYPPDISTSCVGRGGTTPTAKLTDAIAEAIHQFETTSGIIVTGRMVYNACQTIGERNQKCMWDTPIKDLSESL